MLFVQLVMLLEIVLVVLFPRTTGKYSEIKARKTRLPDENFEGHKGDINLSIIYWDKMAITMCFDQHYRYTSIRVLHTSFKSNEYDKLWTLCSRNTEKKRNLYRGSCTLFINILKTKYIKLTIHDCHQSYTLLFTD